jgi:hypothetical protein
MTFIDRGITQGQGFDYAVTPAVTAGAYSAGDIMGALMEFPVCRIPGKPVLITGLQFALKAAVTPSLQAVLFDADPTNTTKTDNAAYSLNAADVFKVIKSVPVLALGGYLTDHGTPNTYSIDGLNIVAAPADQTSSSIYMLLIDLTGVTLTSTSDLQVRMRGLGV